MKKLLLILLMAFTLPSFAVGTVQSSMSLPGVQSVVCAAPTSILAYGSSWSLTGFYAKGCCSANGGICGCKEGKMLCCDGLIKQNCPC